MWKKHAEDDILKEAFRGLDLHKGVAEEVMLGVRQLSAAERAANILLYAALVTSAVSVGVFALWRLDIDGMLSFAEALRGAACVGGVLVGLILTFGARGLSEIDCAVMHRIAGTAANATLTDVVTVRAGAFLILLCTSAIQFA